MPDHLAPAALLWDMDGTLVDTEPHWIATETELVRSYGGSWTFEDGMQLVGRPMLWSAGVLRERGVDLEPHEIVDRLNAGMVAAVTADTPWQPGARELLQALHGASVPMALVTSSYRVLAEPFAAVAGVFDAVVAGDDGPANKPDPAPYLAAAALLGVPVTGCVAVEDSPSGITSAMSAGARVLAVEVAVEIEPRPGLSTTISLELVGPVELARIAAGEVLHLR